jgi:predicted nucleic acid-binding protein
MRYFDTGVLLELYLPEPRADEAVAFVKESGYAPALMLLHEMEMRSALRQKYGRGEINGLECEGVLLQMAEDLDAGVHGKVAVIWPEGFATAETLSRTHGVETLCRSLDTLHVALAIELGATEFCTFDQRQSQIARAAGIRVIP